VSFRLLTYNIRRGGAGREKQLASVIRACDPDLVVLQESTKPDVVERVAALAGMQQWATRPRESLGFMSRRVVKQYVWSRPRISRHAFLEIVPAESDTPVFGVHLSAVHAAWTERRRALELRALLRSIRSQERRFHVLAGDFNTLAPGELLDIRKLPHRLRTLVWLSGGRVRWRTIQMVLDAGYADAFRHLHPDVAGYTFPTWNPHVRLDYVFAIKSGVDRIIRCEVVTHPEASAASDHFALAAEIGESLVLGPRSPVSSPEAQVPSP
jgi:endonuclease/exonuclease/phosphatase family metal-dependent hydrolase